MTALQDDLTRTALNRLSVVTSDGGEVVDLLSRRTAAAWGDRDRLANRVRHLEDRLTETCPDHVACETAGCPATFCEPCKVGDPADPVRMCDHGRMLCVDCQARCSECADEMRGAEL